MKLFSSATETSFLNKHDREYEWLEGYIQWIKMTWMDEKNELKSETEASDELNIGNATSGNKRKVVVAPHRKAKQVK